MFIYKLLALLCLAGVCYVGYASRLQINVKRSFSWSLIEGKKAKGTSVLKNLDLTEAKETCEELGDECEGLCCKVRGELHE